MAETKPAGALSLERRLERLEELVDLLEHEDLELDDALRLFEEGIGHVREVRDALRTRELVVERLIDDSGPASDPAVADIGDPAVPAGGDRAAASAGEEE